MGLARKRRNHRARLPGRYIALGLLIGMMAVAGCLMAPRDQGGEAIVPPVRVRLMARVNSVELGVDGQSKLINASQVRVAQSYGSHAGEPIEIAGKHYHGQVTLVPIVPGESFDVVNVVSIDEYLEGVVPNEAYPSWPIEALKSQAVAARTYALYQLQDRKDADTHFDVYADVRSQAYGSIEDETPQTNQAVQETHGVVLAYGPAGREKIFCAYFSSTCGGITASGADVFDDPTPTLRPRISDGCTDSPRYRWAEFTISKDELTRRIKVWGQRNQMSIASLSKLAALEISSRNELGRPSSFTVTDTTGRRYTLKAEQMRNAGNADGPKDVQFLSSFFTPVDAGASIRITDGRGWGHGVGLCQYCSAGWAKRGMSAKQILLASYPGAVLVRAY